MNFPAKITEIFSIFSTTRRFSHSSSLSYSSSSCRGVYQLGFFCSLHQNREFAGFLRRWKMAWDLNRCNSKTGVVLPAKEAHVEEAITAIKAGKVISVPTDTLYGFACDACSAEAVNRIYEIKGRKLTSPLAICVGDVWDIKRFAVTDHLPDGLLDSLLPGPVTVVLSRGESSILEKSLNPGLDTIGVRVPDYNFIRAIASDSGSALALTSANLSGQQSSICIKDFEDLWDQCAYVFDGGLLPAGRAGSTVVDLVAQGKYKILRTGSAMEETVAVLENFCLQDDDGNEKKSSLKQVS